MADLRRDLDSGKGDREMSQSRVFSRYFGCSPLTVRQAPERNASVWSTIDRSILTGAIVPHQVPAAAKRASQRAAKRPKR